MLDYFNINDNTTSTTIFYANAPTGSYGPYSASFGDNSWQVWSKPTNCQFVSIVAIGGGGGGSAGGVGAINTTRHGGPAGASSSVTRGFFPAWALPTTLYIQVGSGGLGGSGSLAATTFITGSRGALSYVSIQPTSSANCLILKSGTAPAGGGGVSTNNPGSRGSAAVAAYWNFLGMFQSVQGENGGVGVASGTPPNVTPVFITCGGAGGAPRSTVGNNGGTITGSVLTPTIAGGTSTKPNGDSGTYTAMFSENNRAMHAPIFLGGAGGGFSGNGGNGSYGSGGGGGSAITTGETGGQGGRGGDGLVIITAF